MDERVTRWINAPAGAHARLDAAMLTITHYGVPLLILAVVMQWWSRGERLHVRHACVAAGLSFAIGLGLNQIILLFVHRMRPYDAGVSHLIIERSADWSFPSDHATAAFAIVLAFLFQGLRGRATAFAVAAVAVCVSRIYVGTHYVTDILGGVATAAVAALAVRAFYRKDTRLDRMVTNIL
ncbi:phosphatase PAP2 family protein [Mesorhizobium sp. UC22_110]|jgi:undecaprenyl-diphosphatase|uniref:phosphatase PAP2 family protein n=1 Tax=unclassified Mesorhizobium TaxID=325217 RepID=UPI00366B54AA